MAGRIPKHFIDDLLMRVDIVDIVDARVPLKKAGKDYKACCPFHDEKTPSFTVSQTKQFYHCFGCGKNGSAIGFLMDYEHMSFPEAVEELAGRAGLTLPRELETAPVARDDAGPDLLQVMGEAARYYRAQLREHARASEAVTYLKKRGITGEIAGGFALGYAPEGWDNLGRALAKTAAEREALTRAGLTIKKNDGSSYDRFRHRIVFPIHDYRGRIVGFGGRVIDPKDEPKYLNSPETPLFHKGRELYGLYRAREAIRRENRVLVVEGYMDVVALAQFGIDFAVATLGTATTRDHLERLYRFAPEIVFCFDGDRAGRAAAWRALETALPVMHEGRQASFLFLPEGDDPDSLVRKEGRDEFLKRLATAVPLPDFLFQSLAAQVDLRRLDGQARLVELARPLLADLPTGVFQQLMLAKLAEISRVDSLSPYFASLRSSGHKPGPLSQPVTAPTGAAARASRARPGPAMPKPPSLVRIALALLVQHPGLVAQLTEDIASDADLPGAELLNTVARALRDHPRWTTAVLLEHFRDTEHATTIAKLAAWEHPTLVHDVAAEFAGVMAQLRRAATKVHTERLLQKQRTQELTTPEKVELARLLATRTTADTR